jgi:O-antigen ligase
VTSPDAETSVFADGEYQARLPAWLGIGFFAAISFPALVELPSGVTPGQLMVLACLPLWFAASINRDGMVLDEVASLASMAVLLCSIVLIACALISAYGVDVPFRAARQIVTLLTAIALYMLMVGTVTRRRLFTYVNVLCLALAATNIVTVLAFVVPTLTEVIFQGKDRAFGFFKNPNQLGIAISTVLPVAVAMLFAARRHRLPWAACVTFLLLGLMASGSKANLLVSAASLPLCLVLFSVISFSGPKRVLMVIVTVAGCLVMGALGVQLLSILNPRALSLLGEAVVEGEATPSLVTRSVVWADSFKAFRANPILGVGAGTRVHGLAHSHNLLLDYARILGVPGVVVISVKLAAIIAVCAASIRLALRSETADLGDRYLCIGTAIGPIAYIGANFSSDSLGPTTSPFFYSVLFLGLATRSLLAPQEPALDNGADRGLPPRRAIGPVASAASSDGH